MTELLIKRAYCAMCAHLIQVYACSIEQAGGMQLTLQLRADLIQSSNTEFLALKCIKLNWLCEPVCCIINAGTALDGTGLRRFVGVLSCRWLSASEALIQPLIQRKFAGGMSQHRNADRETVGKVNGSEGFKEIKCLQARVGRIRVYCHFRFVLQITDELGRLSSTPIHRTDGFT